MFREIQKLFHHESHEIIDYKDLAQVPFFVWVDLASGLEATKDSQVQYMHIPSKSGSLLFITKANKGFGYHPHGHKGCKETVTTLTGEVMINGHKVLKQYEQETFHNMTIHGLIAITDWTGLVQFTPV